MGRAAPPILLEGRSPSHKCIQQVKAASFSAAKRRKNKAHGVSRGWIGEINSPSGAKELDDYPLILNCARG